MKKIYFLLLATLCLFAPQFLSAQSWSRLTGTLNSDNRADGLLAMPDGGVVTSITTLGGPLGGSDFLVTRYDATGTIMWSRYHGTATNDNFGTLYLDNAGNIILAGYTIQPSSDGALVVLQLSAANGTENWEIMPYESSVGIFPHSVSQDQAGNYIIVGTNFNAAQALSGALILSINASGTAVNWMKDLADMNSAYMTKTGPNRFIISGGTNSAQLCAYKMSISGGVPTFTQGRRYTIAGFNYVLGYYPEKLDNGDLVMLCGTNCFGCSNRNMAIVRTDSNGVAQTAYDFGTNVLDGGYFITRTPQNTVMVYGSNGNVGSPQAGIWVEINPYTGVILGEGLLNAPQNEVIYSIRRDAADAGWFVSGVSNSFLFGGEAAGNFNNYLAHVTDIEAELLCPATVTATTHTVSSVTISSITTPTVLIYTDAFSSQGASPLSQPVCLACGGAPTVSIQNGGDYCFGSAVTLTTVAQGNNLTYAWSHDGTLIPNQNATTLDFPSLVYADGGTYSVTVTNGFGCTASAQATINVANTPEINITGGGTYCEGGAHSIVADLGGIVIASYSWYHDGVPINPSFPSVDFNPLAISDAGVYTIVVIDGLGCSATSEVTLVVEAAPVVTLAGGGSYCEGLPHSLTASSPDVIVEYLWVFNGALLPNETGPSITIPSLGQGNAGTYAVGVINANGCGAYAQVALSVSPTPVVFINGGGSYCYGSPVVLDAQGNFASYAWSYNGDLIPNENGPNLIIPNLTNASAGTYTVTVTDNAGCTGTAQTSLSTFDNPEINFIGGGTACVGGVHTITADVADPNTMTFSWDVNGTPIAGANGPSIELNPVDVDDAGIYTVTVTNANGCSSIAQVELFTEEPAPINLTGGGNYCPGIAHMLSATVGGNIMDYAWTLNGVDLPNEHGASIFFPSLDANYSGTYTLTVTSLNGCTSSAQTTINVVAPPQPIFDAVTYTVCANGCMVLMVEGTSPGDSYQWNTGQTNQSISACPQGNQTYCVTVTNVAGCTGSACTNVVIAAPIQAHFTFSPSLPNNCYKLNFQGSAVGGQAPYTYNWTFVGAFPATGNTQNVNLVTYPNVPGTYNVCLTVTDAMGCTNILCQTIQLGGTCSLTELDFCVNATPVGARYTLSVDNVQSDCNGSLTLAYAYTLVGGNQVFVASSTKPNLAPGHYNVCVRATCTVCGQVCVKICCKEIQLDPICTIPEAASITSINVNNANGDVRFLVTSVTGATYDWDYDNNGTVDQTTLVGNVTRNYPVGTHTVCVTIYRSQTCQKTICYQFVVNQHCNLSAGFISTQCTTSPTEVIFRATGNGATHWEWNFGDGNTASGQIASNNYQSPGQYQVCLTASTGAGCFTNICYNVLVSETTCNQNLAREDNDPQGEWQEVPMYEVETDQEMPLVQPAALKVFPNPARTEAKLEFEMFEPADATILIMDLQGHVVFQQKQTLSEGMQSINIPVYELANGLYSVSVNTGMEVLTSKLSVIK